MKLSPSLRARLSVLLAGWLVVSPLYAITLNDYIADVVESYPKINQRIHYYREVAQDLKIAKKGWRPTIDLDASVGSYSTKSPITGQVRRDYGSDSAALTVTQNLFDGYDTTYQIKQNQARIGSALYRVYDEADNVALEATKTYIEAVKQRRLAELAQENVTSHQHIFDQIRERLDSGVGRRSDMEQTEGHLARARASRVAQENNLQDRLTELHKYLGRYVLSEQLVEPKAPEEMDDGVDELIALALKQHPAIRAAKYNTEAATAEYNRSKSKRLPRVDLQLQGLTGTDISGYSGDTDEYSAVLNLKYNFYNGGADDADERKKISAIYEQSEYEREVRHQVVETLRLAWMARKALQQQLIYLKKYVVKARQTVKSYKQEFLLGHRDLTDLLDAETELNNAQKSEIEARYDLLAADYRIREAIGNLFPALDLDINVSDNGIAAMHVEEGTQDALPVSTDRDVDAHNDYGDHCDNSKENAEVTKYGCEDDLPQFNLNGKATIEHLNFLSNSTELTSQSLARLERIARALKILKMLILRSMLIPTQGAVMHTT